MTKPVFKDELASTFANTLNEIDTLKKKLEEARKAIDEKYESKFSDDTMTIVLEHDGHQVHVTRKNQFTVNGKKVEKLDSDVIKENFKKVETWEVKDPQTFKQVLRSGVIQPKIRKLIESHIKVKNNWKFVGKTMTNDLAGVVKRMAKTIKVTK